MIKQALYDLGIVPVIKITDTKNAVPLADALCRGGLPAAEITFRTSCAAEAISAITEAHPNMCVGAGTVLTPEQADAAISAGAKFVVSPGLNPEIVAHCIKNNIPIVPGCATPSDIEKALSFGLDFVKFFPAEAAGGVAMIKAMSAPYGNVSFMPTGGINISNLLSYLSFSKVIACGGSFMVKEDLISEGRYDEIEHLTRESVMAMLGFELRHVGINCSSADEANSAGADLAKAFGFTSRVTDKSVWAGNAFEILKSGGRGKCGHVALATNFPDRAAAYLRRSGVELDESSAGYDEKGKLKYIYLKHEIAGFAVHLIGK